MIELLAFLALALFCYAALPQLMKLLGKPCAALCVILCGASIAPAQCQRFTSRRQVCQSNYVAPVYNDVVAVQTAFVAVPVLIPSFVFQYAEQGYQSQQFEEQAVQQTASSRFSRVQTQAAPAVQVAPVQTAAPDAVVKILQTRCAVCHSGSGKKGVSFFDAAGKFAPTVSAARIWDAADATHKIVMPPAAKTDQQKATPDNEVAILREWMLSQR